MNICKFLRNISPRNEPHEDRKTCRDKTKKTHQDSKLKHKELLMLRYMLGLDCSATTHAAQLDIP
ncbi:hypothetical protein E2C01_065898 [Portunus trituberculatus]|uniref:Uncharacterized protein n=1 Tax=Portunus trituberculatus TaxID=210409 RepID=A0A5B7HT36_PORTR|nr:hypothetical protein [Portunus trituberculatus]